MYSWGCKFYFGLENTHFERELHKIRKVCLTGCFVDV
jgi:hypothetical protein